MSLTIFLILLIAPAFVGAIIGLVLIIIDSPKSVVHPRHKFKLGDIVELKNGKIATVSGFHEDQSGWFFIRVKGIEKTPLLMKPDGTDVCPDLFGDYSVTNIIGSVDYVV